jgi:fructokinase
MLLSCGEALIDFLPVAAADGGTAIRPFVGGSCYNVAVGMARLGAPTGFIGGISTDLFGGKIEQHAAQSGVDLRFATRSPHQTKLAFVSVPDGQPHYEFYDENTASRNWSYRPGAIAFAGIDALHLGSSALVDESSASHSRALIADARGVATVSFDPNCRPSRMTDKARYIANLEGFVAASDIVRMSDADFDFLYGGIDFEAKATSMLAGRSALVVITCGDRGALAWHTRAGTFEVAAPRTNVVDTVGAGDSFQAALLFALHALRRVERSALAQASRDELERALKFAAACAAVTCSRAGANPPRREEVEGVMAALLPDNRGNRS